MGKRLPPTFKSWSLRMNYRWAFRAYNNASGKQSPDLVGIVVYAIDYDKALEKAKRVSGLAIRKTYDLMNVAEMPTGS